MAVKRAYLSDEDGLDDGPYDDNMSSSESTVAKALVVGEAVFHADRRTSVPSTEAMSLLRRTSRTMRKRGDGKSYRSPEPLVRQLSSLRNHVPYSRPNNNSCVISDALRYLDQLSKQVDVLQMELSHATSPYSENSSKVEVIAGESCIQIHVSCQKRPGLMEDLLTELERLGMAFKEVNVSSHETFILDVVSTQVEGRPVHIDVIKTHLWRTISK